MDGIAVYAQMCVAPSAKFLCPAYITQGNVHAADEPFLSVDDAHFAVVAVVYLTGECRKLHRHEGIRINAGIVHAFKESLRCLSAAHIIVDDAHGYALACFVDKCIGDKSSQGIVLNDIRTQVDVVLRPAYGSQKRSDEVCAVGIDVNLIVLERQCTTVTRKLADESFVALGLVQFCLIGKRVHAALRQFVKTLFAYDTLMARVLSEKEIGNDTHNRQKQQHQQPCQRLDWLTVVNQYGNHRTGSDDDVEGK